MTEKIAQDQSSQLINEKFKICKKVQHDTFTWFLVEITDKENIQGWINEASLDSNQVKYLHSFLPEHIDFLKTDSVRESWRSQRKELIKEKDDILI
jgi:hypothetical protein